MLAQTPRAILMRNLRARRREIDPPKPRGRKTDYAKHARLVKAYEHAKAKGDHALDRLVIREGYAHRNSLLKGYRWALKALSKASHPHPHHLALGWARGLLRSSAMAKSRETQLLWPVYEFRPLGSWSELFRYANGEWIKDDGQHDIAFYGKDTQFTPFGIYVKLPHYRNLVWGWYDRHWSSHEPRHPRGNAWHYALRDGQTQWGDHWDIDAHPNSRAGREAMNKCCGKYRCANGKGPEINRLNEYVTSGLVRERDTQIVFAPPKQPTCMYCGDTDTRLANMRCDALPPTDQSAGGGR